MYKLRRHTAQIPVTDYIEGYVDVETFLGYCKECSNYGSIWSCPPFDFDVMQFWRRYDSLELIAEEIIFDEEYAGREFDEAEMDEITEKSIRKVKADLSEELYEKEREYPGSVSLSAGSCILCSERCTKGEGKPCRFPDKMRYSIEALGGNVGLTISKLMGIEIEWMKDGVLPDKFVLVCGVLKKSNE